MTDADHAAVLRQLLRRDSNRRAIGESRVAAIERAIEVLEREPVSTKAAKYRRD